MKVYFVPGLGADKRVFKHLVLPDSCDAVYLEWLKPEAKESLEDYSKRMSAQIQANEPFYILGLSLGGMIAAEITRIYPNGRLIMISSVPHPGHLPSYFRWMQKAQLQKIVPVAAIKVSVYLKHFFTNESSENKQIVCSMVRESDPVFIKWALNAVLEWKGSDFHQEKIHIHGTKDIVLPVRYTRPTHIIQKGSHLMIMENASEINDILCQVLI
jgi:pimeloyl-ACP methyl ester carboxylesterase